MDRIPDRDCRYAPDLGAFEGQIMARSTITEAFIHAYLLGQQERAAFWLLSWLRQPADARALAPTSRSSRS
jgi:hypothetical protein